MRISNTLLAALVLVGVAQTAKAQGTELATADQTVNMTIDAVNQLSFASSVSLTITAGTIGGSLTAATASSTYGIISNVDSVSVAKISATLDSDMPSGSSLAVSLDAPSSVTGAVSAGSKALSTTSVDLVTNIPAVNEANIPLTYTFSADVNTPASLSRTVHYVLTQGA